MTLSIDSNIVTVAVSVYYKGGENGKVVTWSVRALCDMILLQGIRVILVEGRESTETGLDMQTLAWLYFTNDCIFRRHRPGFRPWKSWQPLPSTTGIATCNHIPCSVYQSEEAASISTNKRTIRYGVPKYLVASSTYLR